jgi:alkane 1-monooxygenase
MHHKEFYNKVIGIFPLTKLMYTQFLDEHLKGHHKTVSTLEDPATSRKNESLYAFIPRSIYGSLVNVWGYESKKITENYGEDANLFIRFFCNKLV